jgi:hypothetical protein
MMCEPKNGKNTPEDVEREARVLEERNGMEERRKREPSQSIVNNGMKSILLLIAGLLTGLFLPQIVNLNREGGEHEQRLRAVESELAQGGRWTLENQMTYASEQQQEIAIIKLSQTEHNANCLAAWEKANEKLDLHTGLLREFGKRLAKLEQQQ